MELIRHIDWAKNIAQALQSFIQATQCLSVRQDFDDTQSRGFLSRPS